MTECAWYAAKWRGLVGSHLHGKAVVCRNLCFAGLILEREGILLPVGVPDDKSAIAVFSDRYAHTVLVCSGKLTNAAGICTISQFPTASAERRIRRYGRIRSGIKSKRLIKPLPQSAFFTGYPPCAQNFPIAKRGFPRKESALLCCVISITPAPRQHSRNRRTPAREHRCKQSGKTGCAGSRAVRWGKRTA